MRSINFYCTCALLFGVVGKSIEVNLDAFTDYNLENYTKCCNNLNYLVKTDNNNGIECQSFKARNFEIFAKETFEDFETDCKNNECVDFLVDKTNNFQLIRIKSCDLHENKTDFVYENITDFVYLAKCCPLSYQYDSYSHHCVEKSGFTLNNVGFQVLHLSMDKCPNNTHAVKDYKESFTINKQREAHLKQSGKIFPNGAYCIDIDANDGNWVVRTCEKYSDVCQDSLESSGMLPCLRKCCPDGKVYKVPGGCVFDYDNGIDISTSSRIHLKNGSNYAVIHTEGQKVMARDEHKYVINENGVVRMKVKSRWFTFSSEKATYCVENYILPRRNFSFGDFIIAQNMTNDLNTLKIVVCFASSIFLMLTILCYLVLPEAKNLHGKSILMHCAVLCTGFALLAVSQYSFLFKLETPACQVIGFSILFTYMAAFSWLNIICFDMWMAFGTLNILDVNNRRKERKKFLWYNLYAWGVPLLITGSAILVFKTKCLPESFIPHVGYQKCFLDKHKWSYYLFYIMPLTLMISANCVLFYKTVKYCCHVKGEIQRMKDTHKAKKNKFKDDNEKMMVLIKLFLLMGVSWLFEIVSSLWNFKDDSVMGVIESIWDTFNSSQGIFIFAIFILKRSVFKSLKEKFRCGKPKTRSECSGSTMTTVN